MKKKLTGKVERVDEWPEPPKTGTFSERRTKINKVSSRAIKGNIIKYTLGLPLLIKYTIQYTYYLVRDIVIDNSYNYYDFFHEIEKLWSFHR